MFTKSGYKNLKKILAKVIPSLVNDDQKGFLATIIRFLFMNIKYSPYNPRERVVVALD